MGAEELLPAAITTATATSVDVFHKEKSGVQRPVVVGLQLSALVDHVASVDWDLLDSVQGDRGGSQQVDVEELQHILGEVKKHILPLPNGKSPMKTIAGGSVANTIRGLSAGFGISCSIIGACGDDEQGKCFRSNMTSNGVNLSRLRMKKGSTAQCVCLVDALGNRTMRPCLSSAVRIQADEFTREDFRGVKWLALRYGFFHKEQLQAAIGIARQEGVLISMDLASFEMVRDYRSHLLDILENGMVDLCFANEDEARELMRGEACDDAEAALSFLAKHCQWAVVTLGARGCIAKHGKEVVRVPAIYEVEAVDATGAGDLFASGFLYGMIRGLSLERSCRVGSCSGWSVVLALGGEVSPESWQRMYQQMQKLGLPVPDHVKHGGAGDQGSLV